METAELLSRPAQIEMLYIKLIDNHLEDLINNKIDTMYEIEDFANLMFIHPVHLSNTIKDHTGQSACGIYQFKILEVAKKLLGNPGLSIRKIAFTLTFDPSQFTKWFKRLYGSTPKQYRLAMSLKSDT